MKANPLLSAGLQFAVLGTLGELLAASRKRRRPAMPFTSLQPTLKVVAWVLLGLVIKYGSTGMKGFTQGTSAAWPFRILSADA